jgi:predicted phosphodiesterase
MRLALLADIHGNLPALKAVLDDIKLGATDTEIGGVEATAASVSESAAPEVREPTDLDARRPVVSGLIVAGDFTGGPQPQEVIDELRSLSLPVFWVRGNAEHYVLQLEAGTAPEAWITSPSWATLRFSYKALDAGTIDWIKGLPEQATASLDSAAPVRVVHGTPSSAYKFLFPDHQPDVLSVYERAGLLPEEVPPLGSALNGIHEPVLVCAHSHIPWIDESTGTLVVNAGSVGGSNNGDPRAQYGLLDWDDDSDRWRASLHTVAYDLDRVRAAFDNTGLRAAGGAMAEAFLRGIVTGTNVPGKLVRHARRLAGLPGYYGGAPPDDIWQRAVETFDWEQDLPD